MATYVIGDLQGCYDPLRRLLDSVRFDPARDRAWFAGDLVNRGPQSLEVLRFVRELGAAGAAVLGNHDLHLLAVANGERQRRGDTFDAVLAAPDRNELLHWLRRQPLLIQNEDGSAAVLHAGLPPQWDLATARDCAREAEHALRGDDYREFMGVMYGNQPDVWADTLTGVPRLRFIINCFTRMRYCDAGGRLEFHEKGRPGTQPDGLLPWFAVPGRRSAATTLVFGHWSTLGPVHSAEHNVYGVDTGAIWGGALTALRLEDRTLHSVNCPEYRRPGMIE
jgi:bis(5'-nucleosyl)-tetraphosphatase (symmetrical)